MIPKKWVWEGDGDQWSKGLEEGEGVGRKKQGGGAGGCEGHGMACHGHDLPRMSADTDEVGRVLSFPIPSAIIHPPWTDSSTHSLLKHPSVWETKVYNFLTSGIS